MADRWDFCYNLEQDDPLEILVYAEDHKGLTGTK